MRHCHGTGNRREYGCAAEVGHGALMHFQGPGPIDQSRPGRDRRRHRGRDNRHEKADDYGHIRASCRTPRCTSSVPTRRNPAAS